MKVDILAVGVHPDDVELGCGGAIIASVKEGKKVAVIDLTRGELGSRGTPETREQEAEAASKIMQLAARENLAMADGFFQITQENTLKVIRVIRKYRPEVLICNAPHDRHPDHGRSSQLVKEAAFLSGLIRIETEENGEKQAAWRPKHLYHYIQDDYIEPDFIFDITNTFNQRQEAILSYTTQFNVVAGDGVQTYISKPQFIQGVEARARLFGKRIGAEFGEGYIKTRALGISSFDRFTL
ncbi:bacillithiol biosynthesis deacetylase BshB1 [Arachidicoccus terrestris]|uniref:bacillithiol biosynthesis deacetylase BshB1 n=1 Tax=Arachidicoccus terrestris TaxID=2875539 RepID=UPI001CC7EE62|nr:bacillithiol biosynthesis deacetylase BshB1 [Arachidicoccus terrestris]UAY56521.1 bacillithiol biosynthesis deacetylase BshB1 [Arachidicoccus terrestris]